MGFDFSRMNFGTGISAFVWSSGEDEAGQQPWINDNGGVPAYRPQAVQQIEPAGIAWSVNQPH